MNLRIFLLSLCMTTGILSQAQLKEFTLEDLIPGGKNYTRFSPRYNYRLSSYNNQLALLNKDSLYLQDTGSPKKKKELYLTSSDIQALLSQPKASVEQTKIIPLTENGRTVAYTIVTEGDSVLHYFWDLQKKQQLSVIRGEKSWTNVEVCPDGQYNKLIFKKDRKLYLAQSDGTIQVIAEDENPDIIFGEAVHRHEFGITKGIFWSPQGNFLAFYRMDESMVTDYPLVDISTRIATVKPIKYPMAGMKSHQVSVGIYHITSGKTHYLKTGKPTDHYLTNIAWSPDEKKICIAEINRGQDTCRLVEYNALSGQKNRILFEEFHEKYIEPENPPVFLKKNPSRFIWQSRQSGYNHLYLFDTKENTRKALTSGKWEVLSFIGIDEEEKYIYISSTEVSPIEEHLFRINLKTGERTRLSSQPGVHSAPVFFKNGTLVDQYSNKTTPLQLDIIPAKGKPSRLFAAGNPYKNHQLPEISVGVLKAEDHTTDLYYRLVLPPQLDKEKKYPVIVYVYGGPHSQLVRNTWMSSVRGWDIYMAQKGYIVFTLDNRGTANRGLDFENIIHRKLGYYEVKDQMKGVEFLSSLPYVDTNRIGIHGWSYGGFMATSLMLRHPEIFKVGVAGGPVIDWKYYEIMYGERYMDTPQENKDGYAFSNLNSLAGNLKGPLLLIHGDEDPVVVWQHSLSFLKACIKAGTYPDYFVYPGAEHNVFGPNRVHLHEKITRYFDSFLKLSNK